MGYLYRKTRFRSKIFQKNTYLFGKKLKEMPLKKYKNVHKTQSHKSSFYNPISDSKSSSAESWRYRKMLL